jgi:hypothetical protein
MKTNLSVWSLFTLNLAALVAALLPTPTPMSPAASSDPTNALAGLNTASLQAIESSWIKVPHTCKAKGFNAEPTPVAPVALSAEVATIYGVETV